MKLSPERIWPMVPVVVLGSVAVLYASVITWSARDPSFALVPDYEARAADYDAVIAQRQVNASLGWQVEVQALRQPAQPGSMAIELAVHDATGAPIDGAAVETVALFVGRARERHPMRLHELTPGRYAASLPQAHFGHWEFNVSVQRGEERYVATQRAYLARENR
jgi:hypothetical protein